MKWLCWVVGVAGLFALISPICDAAVVGRDTVVASVNDRKITAGELEDFAAGAATPAPEDRRELLREYAFVSTIAGMAQAEGIDQKSPYREQLSFSRKLVLFQAMLSEKAKELGSQSALGEWMKKLSESTEPTDLNEDYFKLSFLDRGQAQPATVIAKVNGRDFTAGDIRDLLIGAGPKLRENFRTQPRQFLSQYALMERLAQMAEEQKLPEKSPYREQLAWARLQTLSQAKMNTYQDSINIGPEIQKQYYQAHLDRYTEAKVKAIYLEFGEPGSKRKDGTPVRTEKEAAALAEQIYQKARSGTDFVELVHQYSEDKTSRDKDGDFGVLNRADPNVPKQILELIFALKPGEVSKPARLPNGFYLFRAEEIGTKSLEQVLQTLMVDAKSAKFQEWLDQLRNSLDIAYEKPDYFDAKQK